MGILRLLVVGDETGMRLAMARLLAPFSVRAGDEPDATVSFDVRTAETGAEALERMARGGPGILLLDLKLPGMSGLDVLRQVNERGEIEVRLSKLVSNAMKHNRDGGRVDATVEPGDGSLRVAVADTGIGLRPEQATRLFQEVLRIKNDRTRAIPGTGLGLSIVRQPAQLYGGDVTVESEPEVGSTSTVVLREPSVPANPPAAAAAGGRSRDGHYA